MADLERRFRTRNRLSTKKTLSVELQQRYATLCEELHHTTCFQQHGFLEHADTPRVFFAEAVKLVRDNLGPAVATHAVPVLEGYMSLAEFHEHDLVGLGTKWACCWVCVGRTGQSDPNDPEFYRLAKLDPEYHLTGLAAELYKLS